MEQIKINNKNYNVGFSFLAMKYFEEMAKKSITEAEGTWDNFTYFYCVLKGKNKNFDLTFDQFIEHMDEHPELFIQFQTDTFQQPVEAKRKSRELGATSNRQQKKSLLGLWMLSLLLLVSPVLLPVISGAAWIYLSLKLLVRLIARVGKKPASKSQPGAEN